MGNGINFDDLLARIDSPKTFRIGDAVMYFYRIRGNGFVRYDLMVCSGEWPAYNLDFKVESFTFDSTKDHRELVAMAEELLGERSS